MFRRLLTLVSALSLLLFVATVVLWVCSALAPSRTGGPNGVENEEGQIRVSFTGDVDTSRLPRGGRSSEWLLPGFWYRRYEADGRYTGFGSVKHWLLAAFTAPLPATWLLLTWRRRRRDRLARGGCPSCGYDLRATPGRCPECGAVPAEKL
jgi:hypothetical protein